MFFREVIVLSNTLMIIAYDYMAMQQLREYHN